MNSGSSRIWIRRVLPALLFTFAVVAAGCGGDDTGAGSTTTSDGTGSEPSLSGDLNVAAASSLKGPLTKIATKFEEANPGVDVTFNFGSSGDLAMQIAGGTPADVAVLAAEARMSALASADLLDGWYEEFATNSLSIVTKPGNPTGIEDLSDLATAVDSGATVTLCVETSPCGKYTNTVLTDAGVTLPEDQVTRGEDVQSTLSAVRDGDAAAGIIFTTDATGAGKAVSIVPIPAGKNTVLSYPMAVLKTTENPDASRAFMDFMLGPEAQEILRATGLGSP